MLCQPFAWHTHAHTHILFRKSSSLSSHSNCCACQDMITFRSESSLIRALFMVMWRLWNTQQHTGWRLITGTGGALYVAPIDYFLSQWVTCLQNCSMSRQKPQSFSPCHGVQYTTYFPSHYFQAQHAARIVRRMPPKNTFLLRQTLTVFTSLRRRSFFRQKKKRRKNPSFTVKSV